LCEKGNIDTTFFLIKKIESSISTVCIPLARQCSESVLEIQEAMHKAAREAAKTAAETPASEAEPPLIPYPIQLFLNMSSEGVVIATADGVIKVKVAGWGMACAVACTMVIFVFLSFSFPFFFVSSEGVAIAIAGGVLKVTRAWCIMA
jgi:hypothetical protein